MPQSLKSRWNVHTGTKSIWSPLEDSRNDDKVLLRLGQHVLVLAADDWRARVSAFENRG
jgi:hypothetical protein